MKLDVDLVGAKTLKFVVGSSDDGKGKDHANWADLALEL